jgi:hypothetical protein
LKLSFAAGAEPPMLEDALCAYVSYFRERDVPARRIVDTACVLVDRARSEAEASESQASPEQIERLASEFIDRCLERCMRVGS